MKKITLLFVAAATFTSSCTAINPPSGLNAATFKMHFADQAKCDAFVNKLVSPAAGNMVNLRSVSDMRSWLSDHPENIFSSVVADVQQATEKYGVIHPEQESDQIRVTKSLYLTLGKIPGFPTSTCGPDVREAVMDALYNGIGGSRSPAVRELEGANVKEASEQRWVLLTAVMAGRLPEEWAK